MRNVYLILIVLVGFCKSFSQNNNGTLITGTTPILRTSSVGATNQSPSNQSPANLVANASAGTPTGNSQEVGITEGQLSVSLTGGANYNIPIAVPPGLNGVVPQISLGYSSQGGNGLAGFGWNITGVSAITRIPSTKFHDGIIDAVDFDTLDRFALDGQRLIVKNGTSGVYGADGTEYETENFSNLKIKSVGVNQYIAAFGPNSFTVEYPDGSVATYTNSTINNYDWIITSWTNPQLITITYSYMYSNGSTYIASIKYGAAAGTTQINEIVFEYDNRIRVEQGYAGGASKITDKILKKISVKGNNTVIRNYYLTHDSTSLGYQRLTSITEKTDNDTKFLNPTIFSYDNTSNVGLFDQYLPVSIPYSGLNSINTSIIPGDYDGDCKTDMIVFFKTGPQAKNTYSLVMNINSNSNTLGLTHNVGAFETIFPVTCTNYNNKLLPMQGWCVVQNENVNNVIFKTFNSNTIPTAIANIFINNTKTVIFPSISLTISDGGIPCSNSTINIVPNKKYISGDFNGDGISDVLALGTSYKHKWCVDLNSPGQGSDTYEYDMTYSYKEVFFIDLKNDNSLNFYNLAGSMLYDLDDNSKVEVLDFNGDGKSDFIIINNASAYVYSLNELNELVVISIYNDAGIKLDKPLLIGDYNGDGKADFCIPREHAHDSWNFYFSNGKNSFTNIQGPIGASYMDSKCDYANKFEEMYYISADFNSDGKTDIIKFYNKTTLDPTGSNISQQCQPFYSATQAMHTAIILCENKIANPNQINFTSIPTPLWNVGFKRHAILCLFDHNNQRNKSEFSLILNDKIFTFKQLKDSSIDNMLKSITTGNGVVETITYKPLKTETTNSYTSPNVFFPEQNFIENYPNQDIICAPNFRVVSKLEKSSKTVYKRQFYTYYGPVANAAGLGFIGFRGTMKTNWHNDEPGTNYLICNVNKADIGLRGAITQSFTGINLWNASAVVGSFGFISKSINTYNIDNITGTLENPLLQNKVFKLKNTKTESFNGLDNTSSITTTNYDIFNNPLESETKLKNGTSLEQTTKTTVDYYAATTNPLIIGRPKSKISEIQLPNLDVSKTEELYNYDNNLLSQIRKRNTNSGLTTDYLTEDNLYDTNGNITKKTITAVGETPRVTNYEYATAYGSRFLTKSIDIENLATEFTYNPATGAILTETLPSNLGFPLKTTYTYDAWGKKIKIEDYLGKSVNMHYYKIDEKSAVITYSTVYKDMSNTFELFDDLGRKIRFGNELFSEVYSYTDFTYDIYDRQIKVSEPSYGGNSTLFNFTKFDGYGRIFETIDSKGKTTTINYTPLTTEVNDGTKTKISVKNAIGNTVSLTEDVGGTVTYGYFANGNLKQTTYQGQSTDITQDAWGRKKSLNDPSAGLFSYEYTGFGDIKKETTPNGTTDYTYTTTGKIESKWIKDNLSSNFTNTNIKSTYEYFDTTTKLLKSITVVNPNDGDSKYEYLYDNYKRLYFNKEEFTTILPRTFTKTFAFDLNGRKYLETSTAAAHGKTSSKTVKYEYSMGEVSKIIDNSNQNILWELNNVNGRNQTINETLGNTIETVNTFNQYGLLEQTKHIKYGTTPNNLAIFDYSFDQQRGNLNSRTNSLFNWNEAFTYDVLDRLLTFKDAQGLTTTQTYHDDGRIKTNKLGTYNFTANTKPFQSSSITLSTTGLMTYDNVRSQIVIYNAFKSPIQISNGGRRVSFSYNAMQDRSIMFYGGATTNKLLRPFRKYYSADGSMEIKYTLPTTVAGVNTPEKVEFFTYIGGDAYSAPIVSRKIDNNNSENFFLFRDYQGSILAVVNSTGTIIEKRLFDAWGDILQVQDGAGNTLPGLTFFDRGYTGHEHLQTVGLIHMNARLYDPKLHRFLQPDNYVQDPSNTQNFNRYAYCWNNPLKFTDPSGEWIHILVGAIIGGAINWATHGCQFNAQGLGYFGVGAVAGALTAMVGAGVSSSLAGGSFSAGALGTSSAWACTATTSFWSGAIIGASSGLVGGFATGFGNSLNEGNNFNDALKQGLKDGAVGSLTGGLIGGVAGGIDAVLDGRRFFDGATVSYQTAVPPYTINDLQQNLDASCTPTCGATIDQSFGGTLTEESAMKLYASDYKNIGVRDVDYWKTFATKTNLKYQNFSGGQSTAANLYDDFNGLGNLKYSRFALSSSNHSMVLKSVTQRTLTKINGYTTFKYFFNVMDPAYGASKTINPNSIINVFRLFK